MLFFLSNICPLHHVHQKPPLGLCVVTLTLPKDWFKPDQMVQPHQSQRFRQRHPNRPRSRNHSPWGQNFPASLRAKPGILTDMIQLYYSSFGSETNHKMSPPICVADKQSQRKLYYIASLALPDKETKSNKTMQGFSCSNELEQDELWLNSDVLIYYNKGPVRAGQPVGVSLNLRATFSRDFLIVKYDWLSLESHILDQSNFQSGNLQSMLQCFGWFFSPLSIYLFFCSGLKWRKGCCHYKPIQTKSLTCGLLKWRRHQAPNMTQFP